MTKRFIEKKTPDEIEGIEDGLWLSSRCQKD